MNDDNLQQKQECDEHQQWLEMQHDLGIYRNFAEDFEQFVISHEKENGGEIMITITKFQTIDGKEFETRQEAINHEDYLNFLSQLENSDIYWRDTNADEVAKWIWENFEIIGDKNNGKV